MTLPASFPLSIAQVASELGLSLPIAFNHPWIILLSQKAGLPIGLGDLLGKTGRFDGSVFCASTGGGQSINLANAPWFGGALSGAAQNVTIPSTAITFNATPNWNGNIFIRNNTTGAAAVMPRTSTNGWSVATTIANLFRANQTDSFTILPSS